jgi:F0F1-type ATP synthase assembly protein I
VKGPRGREIPDGWDSASTAWIIVSHLLTGIALYAGLGWLLSLWLPNRPLLIGGGAILGMFLAIFLIHRRLEAMPPAPPATRRGAAVTDPEARRGR